MNESQKIPRYQTVSPLPLILTAWLLMAGWAEAAPVISPQPQSQSDLLGTNAVFTVAATGQTPFTYLWNFNGTTLANSSHIAGATAATLTVSNIAGADAGNYQVTVTDRHGASTPSSVAALTVLFPPGITNQPVAQSALVNSNATFAALASGTAPLSYHWYFNGNSLANGGRVSGATNATLGLSNVQTTDAGSYQLVVTNNYGSATSAVVALTVLVPATLTNQPVGQSVLIHSNATFAALASGTTPLSYHWYFNGNSLTNGGRVSGATNATLSLSNVQTNDAGAYQLFVTNNYGSATSAVAALTVLVPATLTAQPASQSVLAGAAAGFSVTADGTAPLRYQWTLNGTNLVNSAHLSGATNAALTLSNLTAGDTGNYQVSVTNNYGSVTSSNAALVVLLPPNITTQPQNQTTYFSGSATFTVGATGPAPLGYQWFFAGAPLADSGPISGSGTTTLSIGNVTQSNVGNYFVVASNNNGAVTSSIVTLNATNRIHYVNVAGANPVPPYLDWATAATVIQDAVDAATAGDSIVVTNGVYQVGGRVVAGAMTNRLAVTKPLTIQSVNGSAATVIQGYPLMGDSAVRCVSLGSNTTLVGFRLVSGSTRMAGDADLEQSGGGVWCQNSSVVVSNCEFRTCTANNNGGAGDGGTFYNCLFTTNSVVGGNGGGVEGGTLTNCTLLGNSAPGFGARGGGVHNSAVSGSTFLSNAAFYGGAAESSTLTNCVIAGNSASVSGGAGNICNFYNCTITTNTSGYIAGGAAYGTSFNCLYLGNASAGDDGGAASVNLNNCLLAGNVAGGNGGGAGFYSTLNNCTVVGNAAGGSGGGVDSATAYNCVIVGNSAATGTNYSASVTLTVCDTTPGPASGAGNLTNAPVFANAAAGDFRLYPGSPGIDTGNNAYAPGSVDLVGNPRIVNTTVDLGAYELQNTPFIAAPPTNQTVPYGQPAVTFTVTAVGPGPLTYQWLCNGTNLTGATAAALTLNGVQYSQAGTYSVRVANSFGAVLSASAWLLVVVPTPPAFVTQPADQTVVAGAGVTLTAGASGAPVPAYQWYFNNTALTESLPFSGTASSALQISNVQSNQIGSYTVVATNTGGAATSAVAMVSIALPPVITASPQGQTLFVGGQLTLSAAASGTLPLAYQWLYNGVPLLNATNPTLLLVRLQTNQSGNYAMQASNLVGVAISSNANVIATATPNCTAPPSGVVGWWEGEGNANDVTGTNNGSLSPTGATYTNGWVGRAFRFDGNNGYAQIPDSPALKPATLTIEAWVWLDPSLPSGHSNEQIVFKKNSWNAWFEGYSLVKVSQDNGDGTSTDRFQFCVSRTGTQVPIYSQTIAQRGVWYHVAATYDGNQSVLYVNGVAEASATPGFALDYDTTPVFIGTSGTWAPYLSMFGGIIDEVTIYNRALSANELAAIYYAGNGGKCLPPSAPVMAVQPASQTVLAGSNVTFYAVATGVPAPAYQWYFNGMALTNDVRHSGVAGTNLTLVNLLAGDAGTYQVVATNFMGSVTSSVASLTLVSPPALLTQPQAQTVLVGGQATFALLTTGTTPLWYQLLLNGVAVPGMYGSAGTNYSFVLGNLQIYQQGTYAILVTNSYGSVVSSNAFLTVLAPVVFTIQPLSQNIFIGNSATLSGTAAGTQPISYQWLYNGNPLADATNSALVLTNLQLSQTGTYSLAASNVVGLVTSSNATLTVSLPPPCAPAATGLVSWWPAEGNANDLVGANNGTLSASGASYTNGLVGQGFRFDGINGYVQIPDAPSLKPATVTAEAWVWLDPAGVDTGTESIIFKRNSWTYLFEGYSLAKEHIDSVTDRFSFVVTRNGTQVITRSVTVVQRGQWYHVAGTYDGTTATVWVNGVAEASSYAGFALDYGTRPVFIGTTGEPAPYTSMFAGIIDEAAIYSRALTTNEMAAIYNAGVSGKCVPVYPPFLTTQPTNQAVTTNATAAFSFGAGGTQPLSYQWYFNGAALTNNGHVTGATATNLVVTSAQTADAGSYYVVITNYLGSVTSAVASLFVASVPPAVVTQPQSLTANVGTNAVFSAGVTGDAPLTFQWSFNGTPLADSSHIVGSASSNLTIVSIQSSDAGNYSLAITNPAGMATSSVVALTVLFPPAFTAPPTGRSVPPGWPTTLSAAVSGGTPLTYQWQLNGADLPGATNLAYAIAAVGTNDLGFYHLVASNLYNATVSSDAKLTFGNVAAWGRNTSGESTPPPDLTNAFAVAGTSGASYAARADGTLVAWGTGTATNVPAGATNVVGVSSSGGTVALRSDGTIVGWNFGIVAAVTVPAASNIVAVAAGSGFGFALRAEGTLVGWGSSPYTNIPAGLNHVTAIACGIGHSLALKSDGTVTAWGDSSKTAATNVPFNLVNVVGIAAGYSHSLALKGDGTVAAWGSGAGTNLPAGLTNVAAIFAGGSAQGQAVSLAIRSNGTVVVWGDNTGNGETNPPAALATLLSVNGAGAAYHALTVVNNGSPLIIHPPVGLTAWTGRDVRLHGDAVGTLPLSYQWLCNGTNVPGATNNSLVLAAVQASAAGGYQLQVSNAVNLATSLPATLTVISNNTLTFLSPPVAQTNYQGNKVALQAAVLGNGPLTYQWFSAPTNTGYAPVSGATNDLLSLDPALAGQSGYYYVAISNQFKLLTSSPVYLKIQFARAWGYQSVSNPPVNLTNAIAIATGGFSDYYGHYFALSANGKLSSWANYQSSYGETNVAALSNATVIAIAAGYQDSLALKSDGTVYAWGYNSAGQTNPPSGLNNVVAVTCGDYHDLALKSDGTVVGWGNNVNGQVTIPASATNVAAIAAGSYHSVALRTDGSVVVWGNNNYGQLSIPVSVTNVIAVAAGQYHCLALRANGTVVGWGNNGNGQITIPAGLSNIVALSASGSHSTLLRSDGTVLSLGYEYVGYASNNIPADLVNICAIASGSDHDFGLLGTRAPTFTSQPWSRTIYYNAVTNLQLVAKCVGVQPVRFQWQLNGTNLPGATSDTLLLTNQPFAGSQSRFIQPGAYQLIASNAYGITASKSVKVLVTVPLGEAMDTTTLSWSSSGSALWFGQTNVTHDGVDAAQSGSIGNSQETILQTTVASSWPGQYTFWWKVSSEAFFDYLEFRINGVSQMNITGEVDWQPVSFPIAAGTNVLQWRYYKDASNSGGQDTAWVDQFAFIPVPPVLTVQPQPASQTVNLGATVTWTVGVAGAPPLTYLWNQNGTALPGNSPGLTLNSVGRAQNGTYSVIITNAGGSVTSSVVSLKVLVPQLLGAPTLRPDGSIQLSSTDANGGLLSPADLANFEVQGSADLATWVTLTNALSLTNGMLQLQDNSGSNWSSRFYRIIEH